MVSETSVRAVRGAAGNFRYIPSTIDTTPERFVDVDGEVDA